MNPTRFTPVRLEQLEDRCTPTVWNIPWTDGSHLTVSFVPDGTPVDGTTSGLYQKMAQEGLSPSVWQGAILQAFMAWESQTNVNFSVVADNGAPLGAPGAAQGDSRFGDIRIAAIPMSTDVLALTTAPGPMTGTRGGDIVFNSNDLFTVGSGLLGLNNLPLVNGVVNQDLYTLAQHEVGHALGLPDNNDPSSVMYSNYQGSRSGLGASDITAIQALYGTPAPDFYVQAGASFLSTAWQIQAPPGTAPNVSLAVPGDLTTSADVNYFQFKTGPTNANGVTIQLQTSNQSLLAGQVSVYNSSQQLVSSTSATGPGQDLTLTLSHVSPNAKYEIKVDNASGTIYNVGAYQLKVIFAPTAPTVAALGSNAPLDNAGAHATLATALALQTTAGYTANTHYAVSAIQDNAANVDVYSFQSPAGAAGQPNVLTIAVEIPSGGPTPALTVYNSNQQVVAAQVLDNGFGHYSIQVANAQPSATYSVVVSASSGTQAGTAYKLAINFGSLIAASQMDAQGTLSQGNREADGMMSVSQTDLRNFTLSANGSSPTAWVTLTIYNLLGQVVGSVTAWSGQTVSTSVLLNAGTYFARITAGTNDGSILQPIDYVLSSVEISSPVGATLSKPPPATGSGTTTLSSSGSGSSSTSSSSTSYTYTPTGTSGSKTG